MALRAKVLIALCLLWPQPSYAVSDNSSKGHPKHENGNGGGSNSTSAQAPTDQTDIHGAARPVVNVSLNSIVARAELTSGGRAIDAKLIRVGKALVYQITVLTDQGVSRRLYYDAQSGQAARAP